jgi:hypothetical protein
LGSALVCNVLGLSCDCNEPVRSLEEREAAIVVGYAVQGTRLRINEFLNRVCAAIRLK